MEDTAWPLGNRALLGENYLLLLALLVYISSVKKNDVIQPSKSYIASPLPSRSTHWLGKKVGDGFIVFSVSSRDAGKTQGLAL